jgi:phosphoribosylaminoimidazolecarboxamide formyltransferase/IMP cyclohydrolase
MSRRQVHRALLSVSDKTGIVEFARGLAERGAELLSTGGTAKALRQAGVPVREVSDFTGFPEILDGRVKTLHPRLFGGLLFRREEEEHRKQVEAHGLEPIDLVAVNLYPFARAVEKAGVTLEEAVEQIDIGGPSLLRAAAKNFPDVAAIVDPADYRPFLEELAAGGSSAETRFRLARKVYAHTAAYDALISRTLEDRWAPPDERHSEGLPDPLALRWRKVQELRYGENPHQAAAFYRSDPPVEGSFAGFRQLQGKELSYNNLLDADAARNLVLALPAPAVVIVKHNNPCGAAIGATLAEALEKAWSGDPVSAFGGIVATNVPVDGETAKALAPRFLEVVLAPSFTGPAREAFASKKNLRLLETGSGRGDAPEIRSVDGGLLVQRRDPIGTDGPAGWKPVGSRTVPPPLLDDLGFAWTVASAVKSNAIVLAAGGKLLGVGAGQMSRVDSCRLAVEKARGAGHDVKGAVAASDAFFPFPDGLLVLADAGVVAVAHPGGSMRDAEVSAAAEERGLALYLTGRRHFRH